jgi:tRNA (adenine-N(1)-)-methyltransferase non-catalytic subunit
MDFLLFDQCFPLCEVSQEQIKLDRQKIRLGKRKAISDLLNNTRQELFSGEFDR